MGQNAMARTRSESSDLRIIKDWSVRSRVCSSDLNLSTGAYRGNALIDVDERIDSLSRKAHLLEAGLDSLHLGQVLIASYAPSDNRIKP